MPALTTIWPSPSTWASWRASARTERRAGGKAEPTLNMAGVQLDPPPIASCTRTSRSSCPPGNSPLLHALLLSAGKVLSRARLEEQLYAWGEEIESNAVEVHIHHLRRKLFPELIATIRGVGYLIPRDKEA